MTEKDLEIKQLKREIYFSPELAAEHNDLCNSCANDFEICKSMENCQNCEKFGDCVCLKCELYSEWVLKPQNHVDKKGIIYE